MKKLESGVIKKVVLQLGEKEVSLTLEEAKKLHAALNEMFEQKIVREEHYHYPRWYWGGTYSWPTITVGPTITPTVSPSTTPIWYSSSGSSVSYDSSGQSLNMAIH